MLWSADIGKGILITLIAAEKGGNPIKLDDALNRWGSGSTWEGLVDNGYVQRYPEAVTATDRGKEWLKERFEISANDIAAFDSSRDCKCKWDRMSKWEKFWLFIYVVSVLSFVLLFYDAEKFDWIKWFSFPVALISGFFSGLFAHIFGGGEK
ncbi:hypothetical protein ACFL2R_02055 [Patescibacteria group bacterium]